MAKRSQPRSGSLQYWPRKRIEKFLPSVNWKAISGKGLLGYIAYKVGMTSCLVKDTTPNSLTKDKKMVIACSVLELPVMKIFSVRFYKYNQVVKEVLAENLDKELKRIVKIPKVNKPSDLDSFKDYDDIRLMIYSKTKETGIKKTPDMTELGLAGSLEEKLNFAKEKINKEIYASEILKDIKLIDIRGLTKGKGLVGPVKRFGIKLRQHKSEKGVRRPGSLGPWHPAHVLFRVPIAGQMGVFTRIQNNSRLLTVGKIAEKNINPKEGWPHYGNIKSEYVVLLGSVPGPQKRVLLLTQPQVPSKYQMKRNLEFLGVAR